MYFCGTAAETASFAIKHRDYEFFHSTPAAIVEEFQPIRPLEMKIESLLLGPTAIAPRWIATVQDRIFTSVVPNNQIGNHGGKWIEQAVATAASSFFERTGDLLPGEPFIYSSRFGDLVAEFQSEAGTMTAIVSDTFTLLYSSSEGVSVEKKVSEGENARDAVREIVKNLRRSDHRNGVATR
jgi:hypothetical protein